MKFAAAILLLSLAPLATLQAAEVRYVDDNLTVTLRTGQGNSYKILRMLESGTRLELLEAGEEYSLVRDPKGTEGWIQTRFLVNQPVARDRLVAAEQRLASFDAERQKLRAQIAAVEKERQEALSAHTQLEKNFERVQKELAELQSVAAAPMKLHAESKEMRERIALLEEDNRRIGSENEGLRGDKDRKWFLSGAGVLGGGIIAGLLFGRWRRRKSSWGDF